MRPSFDARNNARSWTRNSSGSFRHRRIARRPSAGLFGVGPRLRPESTCLSAPRSSVRIVMGPDTAERSEEHTSELQSLMRISYAVFCLKKKKNNKRTHHRQTAL